MKWVPAFAILLVACAPSPRDESAVAVRLVDIFSPEVLTGSPPAGEPMPRTEWVFSAPAAGADARLGWRAVTGVASFDSRGGRLAGRTSDPASVLAVARVATVGEVEDQVHSVEVRMRASAGANLTVNFLPGDDIDPPAALGALGLFAWGQTPLVPGEEFLTYTLTGPFPAYSTGIRHVVLRPTDAASADFEIESVRVVFRREHLAGIASGVSWQGLHEIYRESLVSRTPESMRFELELPAEPRLELGLATLDALPVTFRVAVEPAGGAEETVLRQTVTTPNRWEQVAVDLAPWRGRRVALRLELAAAEPGAIGLWGAPAVRRRGAAPVVTASAAPPATPPRGVILVMVDTLRADHLDAWGYGRETAPNLSAMAASGARFAHAVSQATWTKVSAPALLTSLYPSTHGIAEFADRLPASATTLAEVYRTAGYATLSFSSVLFTGKFTNLHQGFEELHEFGSAGGLGNSKTARAYVDRLLPWLEQHSDVPFFVYLHLFDPHDPYEPEPPYDHLWFDPAVRPEHERQMEEVRAAIEQPLMKAFLMPTRAELERAKVDPDTFVKRQIDWYDGSIRGFDAELGRLVEKLAQLGIAEDTLLVFVSDHGEEFLEHGASFHGQSVYGELSRVPLLMSWPGTIVSGTVVDDVVQVVDVMPTLLDLSGLAPPELLQGRSLAPRLVAGRGTLEPRPAVTEMAAISAAGGNPPPFGRASTALISGGWKLVHNTEGRGGRTEYELYDFAADPHDLHDVAADHADVVADLAAKLRAWREEAVAKRLATDDAATQGLSAEELQRLRSLGYVQ